ncbi:MAG: hypothetical protein M9910_02205 [Kiritimatiellae bacterium]|nr:hypothetical protein [Kiritimatiellia bacterium]
MMRLLLAVFLLSGVLSFADDVGDTREAAELLSTGSVSRLIERYDDIDFFQVPILPFVTNVLTVSTGTVFDCEMELYAPPGLVVSLATNTAKGAPESLEILNTAMATRAYLSVKSLAEFSTGTYHVAVWHRFTDANTNGLPDEWELATLGVLTNATAGGDWDGDGFRNRDEWLAGTHPNDAGSALRISRIQRATNGTLVTWSSLPTGLYRVQAATNLFSAWSVISDAVLADSNSTTQAVPGAVTGTQFRVELLY